MGSKKQSEPGVGRGKVEQAEPAVSLQVPHSPAREKKPSKRERATSVVKTMKDFSVQALGFNNQSNQTEETGGGASEIENIKAQLAALRQSRIPKPQQVSEKHNN